MAYVQTAARAAAPASENNSAPYSVHYTRNGRRRTKRFGALHAALAFQRSLPWGARSRLAMEKK